jgi:hypothetical protein
MGLTAIALFTATVFTGDPYNGPPTARAAAPVFRPTQT